METTHVPNNKWLNKEVMVHIHVLISSKKDKDMQFDSMEMALENMHQDNEWN